MENLISLKEAAEFFRMSTVNLKRLVKAGKVRSIKLKGNMRIEITYDNDNNIIYRNCNIL